MGECNESLEMRNLAVSSELSRNEIKTIGNLGLTSEDLRKLLDGPHLAEGSYAVIFELPHSDRKIVAKAWKDPKLASERAKPENAALRLLQMRGSKTTPRLMGYLKSAAIIFEEKIEAGPIEEFDKPAIDQLAVAIAEIHSIELNAYGKSLSRRKRGTQMDCLNDGIGKLRQVLYSFSDLPEITALVQRTIDKAEERAREKTEAFRGNNFTLIHFDLNRNNILRAKDSDKIILVDWGQASAGDNAMDIAKLFLKLDFNEEKRKEFLAEYQSRLPGKDEHFLDRLEVYEPLVLVNSILWRLGVLNRQPRPESPEAEKQFYTRVKTGLDDELDYLQVFLSGANKK